MRPSSRLTAHHGIFVVGHWLKVRRVDACHIPAAMVQDQAFTDLQSRHENPRHAMRAPLTAVQLQATVAVSVALGLPLPTVERPLFRYTPPKAGNLLF
jgi:ABC-type transport system involved in Fe-S cluster assembly fused permease/ATPase subunit